MIYLRNAPKTLVGNFCSRRQSGPASKPQANKALSSQRTPNASPQNVQTPAPRFNDGLAEAPESVVKACNSPLGYFLWDRCTSFTPTQSTSRGEIEFSRIRTLEGGEIRTSAVG